MASCRSTDATIACSRLLSRNSIALGRQSGPPHLRARSPRRVPSNGERLYADDIHPKVKNLVRPPNNDKLDIPWFIRRRVCERASFVRHQPHPTWIQVENDYSRLDAAFVLRMYLIIAAEGGRSSSGALPVARAAAHPHRNQRCSTFSTAVAVAACVTLPHPDAVAVDPECARPPSPPSSPSLLSLHPVSPALPLPLRSASCAACWPAHNGPGAHCRRRRAASPPPARPRFPPPTPPWRPAPWRLVTGGASRRLRLLPPCGCARR